MAETIAVPGTPKIEPLVRSATSCWTQKPYQAAYNLNACKGPSCAGPFTYFVDWDAWYGDENFGTGSFKGGSIGV